MMTKTHMSCDIAGFLSNMKGRKLDGVIHTDDGKPMSGREARAELTKLLSEGKKVIRMCDKKDCPDFDEYGGGCPGHPVYNDGSVIEPNEIGSL